MTITLKLEGDRLIESPFILFKLNVSEAEFWSFADEDIDCELIEGVLVIHSPANREHEDIFGYLYTIFRQYLESNGNGKVFGSRFVMRLSTTWNPEPDLLAIRPEKYGQLQESHLEGPADLVVEILSDATRDVDLTKKLPKYLESGVGEAWIIDPKERTITIHSKDRVESYTKADSDEAIRSKVFPTLQIEVRWIWNRSEFPTVKVTR